MYSEISQPQSEYNPSAENKISPKAHLEASLRPSPEVATKITTRVEETALGIIEKDSHPDMRRVLETGMGIYLWEQGVLDTGEAPPVGIIATNTGIGWGFDPRHISRREYQYFINSLDREGVIDEVAEMQRGDRREHRETIITAMENLIQKSPLTDFFASFSIQSQKELEKQALSPLKEAALRSNLTSSHFVNTSELSQAMKSDPAMKTGYINKVERPVAMATTTDTQTKETGTSDPVRTQFREFFTSNLYAVNWDNTRSKSEDLSRFRKRLTVNDGKLALHYGDGEWWKYDEATGENVAATGDWFDSYERTLKIFSQDLLAEFNKEPYFYNTIYPARALALIGTRLYDSNDKRDVETIIQTGIHDAAEIIADEIIEEAYAPLTEYGKSRISRLAWLHNTIAHIDPELKSESLYTQSEKKISPRKHWTEDDRESRKRQLSREQQERQASIAFIRPAVLEVPHRLMHKTTLETDMPSLPPEDPDLIVDFQRSTLKDYEGKDADPRIDGMRLIARDDLHCYFQLDTENTVYQPVTKEIPHINQLLMKDFCEELGMKELAKQLGEREKFTITELVDLLKQYTRYYFPKENEDLEQLNQEFFIKDGKLLGGSYDFSLFLDSMLNHLYDDKDRHQTGGLAIQNSRFMNGEYLWQTRLRVPEEGIDALLDISPPYPFPEVRERVKKEDETLLSITTAAEIEALHNLPIATVEFADAEVFSVPLRLMTPTPRNHDLPHVSEIPFFDAHLSLKFTDDARYDAATDSGVIDDEHDPFVYGMKIIARDDETKTYYFQIDSDNPVYEPISDKLSADSRHVLAEVCAQGGMDALAKDITSPEDLSFDEFRLLVRKYSKHWTPKESPIKPFVFRKFSDFAENGLVDPPYLRGQCDAFEAGMRDLIREIDEESNPTKVSGYCVSNRAMLDSQMHTQTLYRDRLIDVEPDPKNAESDAKIFDKPAIQPQEKPMTTRPTVHVQSVDGLTIPQPAPIAETIKKDQENASIKKTFEATSALFNRELATYLEMTGDTTHREVFKKQLTNDLKIELKKWPTMSVIPHLIIWRIIDRYQDWRYPDLGRTPEEKNKPFSLPDTIDINQIETWIKHYKERKEPLQKMIKQGKIPDYDPKFVETMDEVIQKLKAWEKTERE